MLKRLLFALCMTALATPLALAQTWPDRPIRFLMTAPAGSSIDVLGRGIADKLKDRLGQPVVVENKPAAGGTVATAEVAHAAPDGYTMVLGYNGPLAFSPLLQKLPYDVARDLAPVIITSSQPNVLAVNATLPDVHGIATIQDQRGGLHGSPPIAWARAAAHRVALDRGVVRERVCDGLQ